MTEKTRAKRFIAASLREMRKNIEFNDSRYFAGFAHGIIASGWHDETITYTQYSILRDWISTWREVKSCEKSV
jgi:uncharacterized protein (DUF2267 family)